MTTDNRYANKYKYNVDGMNVLTKDRSRNKKTKYAWTKDVKQCKLRKCVNLNEVILHCSN